MRHGGAKGRGDPGAVLFGTSEQVGVGRGLAGYPAGRPVVVSGGGETLLTLPVEGLDIHRYAAFTALCQPIAPRLVITAKRARSLGLVANDPVALELAPDTDVSAILALVAEAKAADAADSVFVPE